MKAPHIGHLHTLVLSDVIARFAALRNPSRPVVFATGTDEHGLKIQQAAKNAGVEEREFCDGVSQRFRVGRAIVSSFRSQSCSLGTLLDSYWCNYWAGSIVLLAMTSGAPLTTRTWPRLLISHIRSSSAPPKSGITELWSISGYVSVQ